MTPKFAGGDNDALFAVYDGHGKRGHDCARFAKRKLPNAVAKYLRQARVKKYQEQIKKEKGTLKGAKAFDPQNWPELQPDEYKLCCKKAFLEVNKDMHKADSVRIFVCFYTICVTRAVTTDRHPSFDFAGGR